MKTADHRRNPEIDQDALGKRLSICGHASWLRAPCCFVLVFACCVGQFLFSAENVLSVPSLNESKPWEKFVDFPTPLRVEGRLASFGSGQFRLARCDAKFIVDNSKLCSVVPKSTVEATGRFKKNGTKLEFIVDDLKTLPGYAEQFDTRVVRLKRPTAKEWIELGDWIGSLGRFYEDAELAKKASAAYSRAIEIEHESLKSTDVDGRFQLAKKVDEFGLSSRWRMELIHEGLRIQWQNLQKAEPTNPTAWRQFAATLGDQLPGAATILQSVPRDLVESYEHDPVGTYEKADDDLRIPLHRLFFVAVVRKSLLHGISSNGSDGDVIADQIEKTIPEESVLAEQQRMLRLRFRLAHIGVATKSEAESLSAAFRSRRQDGLAKQTLSQWIKSHEVRLKGDGVVGLLQLADESLTLLKDEALAVEYLTEAFRIDPTYDQVQSKLASLGYERRNGRWAKANPHEPEISNDDPPSSTELAIGMSAGDLRRILGQPESLTRAITSRGITEVWSFGPPGSTRLVIRLEQKATDKEPKITKFSNPK